MYILTLIRNDIKRYFTDIHPYNQCPCTSERVQDAQKMSFSLAVRHRDKTFSIYGFTLEVSA